MSDLRHNVEEIALRIVALFLRLLWRRASLKIGAGLGSFVYLIGIRKDVARENLARAFPELPPGRIAHTVKACYRHFGTLMVEFFRLPLLKPSNVQELVEIEGREVLDEAIKKSRGGIVVSGHFGNWELMGASTAVLGYPVSYVVTSQQNPRVERLMDQLRQNAGVKVIKRGDALKGILKALKNNELVAILSDQDAHEAGVFVPFFGRRASTPKGAATFALRTGADLIFAESYRRGYDRLKVVCKLIPQDDLPQNREEAILELTRRFTAMLEEAVRRHPEQYLWMHRRWKTSPPPV